MKPEDPSSSTIASLGRVSNARFSTVGRENPTSKSYLSK
jgi:hypothetical protein